jgi:hypothetical protein
VNVVSSLVIIGQPGLAILPDAKVLTSPEGAHCDTFARSLSWTAPSPLDCTSGLGRSVVVPLAP